MCIRDSPNKNYHKDRIIKSLITPNRKEGQSATFNPSIWPEIIPGRGYPILTRSQKDLEKSQTGTSETILGYLTSPTELSSFQKIILSTRTPHATEGHEDTRIHKYKGTYYLTSIAFDGKNTRVVEHKTKNLEGKLEYQGVIGPQILLERAVEIVGKHTHYGRVWERHLSSSKLKRSIQLLSIKDASKIYIPDGPKNYKPGLIIRATPHIQLIIAENENDFLRNEFWEHAIENIKENTILTKERSQAKIGIGSPPIKVNGKYIGTYHIVEKEEQGQITIYKYYGSFYEFNPKTKKIVSRIKDPLFHPTNEYALVEQNEKGLVEHIKFIDFPSGIIPDIRNDDLYTYIGHGDKLTDVYVTSIKWVCDQLNKQYNRQNLADFSLANTKQKTNQQHSPT